jgi:hypothetical protein
MNRGAGLVVGGIEPTVRDPMAKGEAGRQQCEFAQQVHGANLTDARHT